MKLKQLGLALVIVVFALTAQLSFSSPVHPLSQQPPMTKATPPTRIDSQNANQEDPESARMIKAAQQCQREARRDYRKCLKRGRNRKSCSRTMHERMSACSG